ncbi:hypothetical protein [Pseudomonas sp. Xaverov 259]|uniref:hypothetical protein n=1 Tax=Pseudomonas sp. Xaverov 259 TaxID=2666086 RepID=UPI001C5A6BCF|nr:hypothetical protein [Pseudomonas sp. Xaverov 259]
MRLAACFVLLPLLNGCDAPSISAQDSTPDSAQQRWLDVPALPIMQKAVLAIKPTIEPQRDAWAMQNICGLARGDRSEHQVNQALTHAGVDLSKTPEKDSLLDVLVRGNTAQRSTICAVYLVKTLLSPPLASDFMSMPGTAAKNASTGKPEQPTVDKQQLNQTLAAKLAVAKASADVFALIASQLQQVPGLTVEQYHSRTQLMFSSLAPAYLKRVRELYAAQGVDYLLTEFSDERFAFRSSDGSAFEFSRSGMTLKFNNITWIGDSQLLGKAYYWRTNYFGSTALRVSQVADSK